MCKVVLDDRFGWAVERCEERQLGASCSEVDAAHPKDGA